MGVLHWIDLPTTVLDIGIGFGKYGFLMREHLDIRKRRYEKDSWKTRIDGIESYSAYITPMHEYLYDHLYTGDVLNLIDSLENYDLMILADVIEHLPKEDGLALLQKLFQKTNRAMVVSYPSILGSEYLHWDNPREKHHCVWTPKDFDGFQSVKFNGTQVAYILKES